MRGTSIAIVVLPAPDGPTSATVSPGSTTSETSRRIQSLGSSPPGVPGASSDGDRDLVARRVAEPHVLELDAALGVDEVDGAGPVGDRRGEVEHLEHALERDERGEDVDARVRELRERLVDLADVDHERDDRAGRDRARDREVAADEVDDRGADRGDEPERDEQDRGRRSRCGRRCRARRRRGSRTGRVRASVRPNSLASSAPATLKRSTVMLFISAFSCMPSRVSFCMRGPMRRAGQMKSGKHEQREQREPPLEPEHDREHDGELDDVRHDGAERVGDRLLRADDVVVQPRLERTGLRAGEERDRHALHVVEERDAQVVDESLADRATSSQRWSSESIASAKRERDRARARARSTRCAVVMFGRQRVVDEAPEEQRRDRGDDRVERSRR